MCERGKCHNVPKTFTFQYHDPIHIRSTNLAYIDPSLILLEGTPYFLPFCGRAFIYYCFKFDGGSDPIIMKTRRKVLCCCLERWLLILWIIFTINMYQSSYLYIERVCEFQESIRFMPLSEFQTNGSSLIRFLSDY